jgi:hypothetical protein
VYVAFVVDLAFGKVATRSLKIHRVSPRLSGGELTHLLRKGRTVSGRVLYAAVISGDSVKVTAQFLDHPDLNRSGPAIWDALS